MRRDGTFEMFQDSPRMLPRFITPSRIDVECSIKSQARCAPPAPCLQTLQVGKIHMLRSPSGIVSSGIFTLV